MSSSPVEANGEKKEEKEETQQIPETTPEENPGVKLNKADDKPLVKASRCVVWSPITKQGIAEFLHLCNGYTSILDFPGACGEATPSPISKEVIQWQPVSKEDLNFFETCWKDPHTMDLKALIDFAHSLSFPHKLAGKGVQTYLIYTIEYIQYLKESWGVTEIEDVEYWLSQGWGSRFH